MRKSSNGGIKTVKGDREIRPLTAFLENAQKFLRQLFSCPLVSLSRSLFSRAFLRRLSLGLLLPGRTEPVDPDPPFCCSQKQDAEAFFSPALPL